MKNKNKSADFKHSLPLLHIMLSKGFSKHFRTDPSKYPKSVYPRHLQGIWLLHFTSSVMSKNRDMTGDAQKYYTAYQEV